MKFLKVIGLFILWGFINSLLRPIFGYRGEPIAEVIVAIPFFLWFMVILVNNKKK